MNQTVGFIREDNTFERLVRTKWFWIIFLFLGFTYPIYRSVNRELPEAKPILGKVPEFSFIRENGKVFGSHDLKGRVYIANFAFTSCPTTCPALMEKMQKVQKRIRGLGEKVGIVTFSVDPVHDTAPVLNKYARELKANPYVWSFLTGNKKEMRSLLIDGFKVPMGEQEEMTGVVDGREVSLFDIAHTTRLALIDGEGNVRGYYTTEKDSINFMMIDLGLLVNRKYDESLKLTL